METPRSVSQGAFLFVLQELLKTPGINRVNFIQVQIATTQFSDAQGNALSVPVPPVQDIQTFSPADVNPSVKFQSGQVVPTFEVYGRFPLEPDGTRRIPAPGMLSPYLQKFRENNNPVPIVLLWIEYDPLTYDYRAISQGGPQVQEVGKPPQLN